MAFNSVQRHPHSATQYTILPSLDTRLARQDGQALERSHGLSAANTRRLFGCGIRRRLLAKRQAGRVYIPGQARSGSATLRQTPRCRRLRAMQQCKLCLSPAVAHI